MADGTKLTKWLKLAVFSLAPAALLLAVTEVCATFAIERQIQTDQDSVTGQAVYRMKIGRFPWSRESSIPLNSRGFPDVEFEAVRKDSCLHVVFAGDSFVFGDGVDRDSSFVGLVSRWSRERRQEGRCVRVFNLGERGTTIDKQAERIRETMTLLQPDVVILGQYQNDLTDLTNARASDVAGQVTAQHGEWTDVRQRLGSFNLNVVRLMSYHMFGAAIKRDMHYDLLAHWSVVADTARREMAGQLMSSYTELYATLSRDLEAKGVAFGVIILPSKFDLLAGRFPEEEFFLGLAGTHSVPHLRTFPVLDEHRSPYPYLMYDGHLNEQGNRLVAESVFAWLYDSAPAPFPVLRD